VADARAGAAQLQVPAWDVDDVAGAVHANNARVVVLARLDVHSGLGGGGCRDVRRSVAGGGSGDGRAGDGGGLGCSGLVELGREEGGDGGSATDCDGAICVRTEAFPPQGDNAF